MSLPFSDSDAVCKWMDHGCCMVYSSTGRLGTTKFAPQNGRQIITHEIVQGTSGPVCIDQVAVYLPRACQRPLNSFLCHFREGDALDPCALQHILQNRQPSSALTALWCVALPTRHALTPPRVSCCNAQGCASSTTGAENKGSSTSSVYKHKADNSKQTRMLRGVELQTIST